MKYLIYTCFPRFGSDNNKGASWHPSRAFHLLRGEAISWHYVMALLDAIYMIEEDQETMTKKQMHERTYVMTLLFI